MSRIRVCSIKKSRYGLLLIMLLPVVLSTVLAQDNRSRVSTSTGLSAELTIYREQVRFRLPQGSGSLQLEIYNQNGELVFDSGLTISPELNWEFRNGQGEPVSSGVYAYKLTMRSDNTEPATQRGHLIVDRRKDRSDEGDRFWITGRGVAGAGASDSSDTVLTGDQENTLAGVRTRKLQSAPGESRRKLVNREVSDDTASQAEVALVPVEGSGTAGMITKWTSASQIGDSVMTENNGNIGIGTTTPGSKLAVAGTIESSGGVKYPDGLTQTAAFIGRMVAQNTFVGIGSGALTTGNENAFFGYQSGANVTTGIQNSFFGHGAGQATNTGVGNVFLGYNSGFNNVSGSYNTFTGHEAGLSNLTGGSNSFFGVAAGRKNTSGSFNSFFGLHAGRENISGRFNSFFGSVAATLNTTGSSNSMFGSYAGSENTTGNNNSMFGTGAGQTNQDGSNNSFFGFRAGQNATANNNSFYGYQSGQFNTTGTGNSFFGYNTGNANLTGVFNVFIGDIAGEANTTGSYNAFFGASAGNKNTIGGSNLFIGNLAGFNNTEGNSNVFIGQNAGDTNTTEPLNTAIGFFADVIAGVNNGTAIGANTVAGAPNGTAIGANAQVTRANSIVLGGITGVGGGTDTNVGIGITAPSAKLHVKSGDVYLETIGTGVILKSPDGTCYRLTVANGGGLNTAAVACP